MTQTMLQPTQTQTLADIERRAGVEVRDEDGNPVRERPGPNNRRQRAGNGTAGKGAETGTVGQRVGNSANTAHRRRVRDANEAQRPVSESESQPHLPEPTTQPQSYHPEPLTERDPWAGSAWVPVERGENQGNEWSGYVGTGSGQSGT